MKLKKKHFTEGSLNAQFTSAKIQNQLINICRDIISEKIVDKINQAKIFSVMVDEITDVSKKEQMSLYIHCNDSDLTYPLIRKDILKFVVMSRGVPKFGFWGGFNFLVLVSNLHLYY